MENDFTVRVWFRGQVRVDGFRPSFDITESGIHRPFIVHCRGSDGREYKQLVKGNDDVRQDMVMMQVGSAHRQKTHAR